MYEKPVVDALYEALINEDHEKLSEIQRTRYAECNDLRILICTENSGGVDLDFDMGLKPCEYVTPIFEGPRAMLISRHTAVQAHITGGRSNVLVDYSLSFDSNFAQRLRSFVNSRKIEAVEWDRVVSVLRLKAANPRVQFDVIPFLNENTRFVREAPDNLRPVETLIAFRMLDHLNWQAFLADPTQLDFGESIETLHERLKPGEEAYLSSLYSDARVLKQEAMALGTQALLLRLATLRKRHKQDLKSILRGLLDFSILELGAVPITELTLIWKGFSTRQPARFFGPLVNPSGDVVADARSMAWDLTHLRSLQDVARQTQLGSFFVPYFVSFDARWREMLRLNPIRLMLMDDATCGQAIGRTMDREFHPLIEEVLSEKARLEMTPEKIAARRLAARTLDYASMQVLVQREKLAWT